MPGCNSPASRALRCAIARCGCRRPGVDADRRWRARPQRLGADRRAVRQRNGDAGIGAHRRLDPRAFEAAVRASDTGKATDDVKLRQIVEPVLSAGALAIASAQIPFGIRDGRISDRRHHARRAGLPRHHIRRLRHSRRPDRHSRQPRRDGNGAVGEPAGNSAVRGRHARCARPHRRRRGAVGLAGGARDRLRDKKARCDRTWRAAAAIAAAAACGDSAVHRGAGRGTACPADGEVPIPGRDQRRPPQPKAKAVAPPRPPSARADPAPDAPPGAAANSSPPWRASRPRRCRRRSR